MLGPGVKNMLTSTSGKKLKSNDKLCMFRNSDKIMAFYEEKKGRRF